MITREKFYVSACDGCEQNFEWDDGYYVSPLKSDLKSIMVDQDWVIVGRKCYCPECVEKGIDKQNKK